LIGAAVSSRKVSTRPMLRAVIRYPLAEGRLVLRTDGDWTRDVAPVAIKGSDSFEFEWPGDRPFGYFKPVIVGAGPDRWAVGPNSLAVADRPVVAYPYFAAHAHCAECEIREIEDASGQVVQRFRAFYPPGYFENALQRYPVLYMQDGQNLFFPDEAFGGAHWRIAETLSALDAMNVLRRVIVVGLYAEDRERSYTLPGYHAYGRRLVEQVKPVIDREYRTMPGPDTTAVMGSSLGGVVSLYLAWQYPEVFGMAACLSSTFGWADDLRQRIEVESRRPIRIYLDSGWPDDNYEATRAMHALLRSRGYVDGHDLSYLAFPEARHNEYHWAMRAHIPFQRFFGEAGLT
jgi:predicted alpha/beta superfamily hydrolase